MELKIKDRIIGEGRQAFIVAELSCNHLQDFEIARESIRAIKEAGADAVKLQTYTADTMTLDSPKDYFKIKQGGLWQGMSLYQLYQKASTPWQWQPELKKTAEGLGLICFSSAFSIDAVDFLEEMGVPAYKVASPEITDIPLIEYIASKAKPVILSTGMAGYADIKEAVAACRRMQNNQIALLECASFYPAPPQTLNLKMIPRLAEDFQCVSGISDHTSSISIPAAAAALGAKIIEKHFILDKKLKSLDADFSLSAEEFKSMVKAVREAESALGKAEYKSADTLTGLKELRRSLFAVRDIKPGEVFTENNIRSIRPGYGIAPKHLKEILGKRATADIERGTPLRWEMVS